jgi:hypothetical protein
MFLAKLFSLLRRGGPICPPYCWAPTPVRPDKKILNENTWDAILKFSYMLKIFSMVSQVAKFLDKAILMGVY